MQGALQRRLAYHFLTLHVRLPTYSAETASSTPSRVVPRLMGIPPQTSWLTMTESATVGGNRTFECPSRKVPHCWLDPQQVGSAGTGLRRECFPSRITDTQRWPIVWQAEGFFDVLPCRV